MPGVWTAPANPPTFNVGTMLLLTDGSVLAQDSGTINWWKLTPDPAGQYVHGRWSPVRSARNAVLYFASAVLRDGTVFVAGGEVANGHEDADLCAAELYDPVADQWSDLPTPDGWTRIGDAPCCVLPDGKVLLGSIADNRCAIFDPVSRTWSPAGPKQNASSNEETWTLLPDGSVVTADCFGHPASERFVDGSWISAGTTGIDLVEDASHEIGPAILLPDGRVFAIGATGATALFTPPTQRNQPGTWTRGPDFPQQNGQQLAAKDAPACLLPNGRVLCVAGPVDGTANTYAGPTIFFEFDLTANALTRLPSQPANAGGAPYEGRMLLLPTGEVVFANGTTLVQFYRPDGVADQAWQPKITACPAQIAIGATVRLEGTQLNGLSQACSYGDDASMATNYPLVRLRSVASPGTVFYCRSFNHSTMAVATGASVVSTSFIVPKETPAGAYMLSVVANGIGSAERAVTVAAATHALSSVRSNVGNDRPLNPREFALQHELFWRDLNEVHLLMDYVSGRTDKSLTDLKGVADRRKGDDPTAAAKDMPSDQIVEEVCMIRFPPEGSIESKAQQAAFLLTVKDRLNALADPARGVTVAYTAMFSGIALASRSRWATLKGIWVEPTRSELPSFAKESYPNLVEHARAFQTLFTCLAPLILIWAILTAFTYWDVALTGSVLQRIDTLVKCSSIQAKPATAQPSSDPSACTQIADPDAQLVIARQDLKALADDHMKVHPVGWLVAVFQPLATTGQSPHPTAVPAGTAATADDLTLAREQLTATIVSVMSSYVVPIMFALLGTFAAMVRWISSKVTASTLSPRDYKLFLTSPLLGLVAGLAVGLLWSGSSSSSSSVGTLAGGITLTAAGLAFLAGYGAEAFFTMLDALLTRVFALTTNGGGK
ncbi:MAG TPA: hypothetical protein VGG99_22620 [Acetobacteraceae bacterium]|jgi:hypothetical protein